MRSHNLADGRQAHRQAMKILRSDITRARARANPLLRIAAKAGIPEAQYALGESLEFGLGAPPDPKLAYQLYRKAATAGYPAAQYSLGVCFFQGIGVRRNIRNAIQWF